MMAINESEVQRLEQDFLSGRNPRAYIPLCSMLRRDRQLQRALEYCQRGLRDSPDSLAGRMLLIRLNSDLGHYSEALRQIDRTESQFGETVGLLVEKANCQIRVMDIEGAAETYRRLDRLNPFDPRVAIIGRELRSLRSRTVSRSSDEIMTKLAAVHGLEFIVAAIRKQISGLGKVNTIAIVDLDSNKTCVEGDPTIVEAAEGCFADAAVACDELGQGQVVHGILEIRNALVLVIRRERRLVTVAVDPQVHFGRFFHRMFLVLQQYLPTPDTVVEEEVEEAGLL